MHSELRQTDVKWIAEGYWREHFRWHMHPEVKTPWIVAAITFVVGIAVILGYAVDEVNSAVVESGPSAIAGVAIGLMLVALGFYIKGLFSFDKAKEQFITSITNQWEGGNRQIPDPQAVEEFINHREVSNGSSKG